MSRCDQELCENWSGDGRVCPCALFDLPRNPPQVLLTNYETEVPGNESGDDG